MLEKIKQLSITVKGLWEYIQGLLDVNGDVIMMAMSSVFIARVAMTAFGYPALTTAESTFYGSAILSFAYSNKGGSK